MEPECINLRERFDGRCKGESPKAGKYRVEFDPCYSSAGVPRDKLDPWYMLIPCKYGHIYPYGDDQLAIDIEGHCQMRGMVKRLGCTELYTEGDDDICCLFDVADFDKVAELVKPRKWRQVSDEERERLHGFSKDHGYKPATNRKGPPFSSQNASEPPTRLNIPFSDLDASTVSRTPF